MRERWGALVRRILDARKARTYISREVDCSQGAREVLREFHNEAVRLRIGAFADVQGELSRWRENACRASLALAVGDSSDVTALDEAQAVRAVSLVRWAQLSTLGLLAQGRTVAAVVLEERLLELLKAGGGQMTLRDLSRRHGINQGQVDALVSRRPQCFSVERKQGGRGRSSEVLRLL